MTDPRRSTAAAARPARPVAGAKRPHPAARARIITAGIAGTAAFGMVAAMALPSGAPAASPAPSLRAGVTTDGNAAVNDSGRSLVVPVPAPSVSPAPATNSSGS